MDPESGKEPILTRFDDYLKAKKKLRPQNPLFAREHEFDLVRDQMIEAFVEISNFDSERKPPVDLFALLRSMLNLGICMLHKVFSKKMLKIVYSSVHSQLAPDKLPLFWRKRFGVAVEASAQVQSQTYQRFSDRLFAKLDQFSPQLILFLLKVVPAHQFKREAFVGFVQSHLAQ